MNNLFFNPPVQPGGFLPSPFSSQFHTEPLPFLNQVQASLQTFSRNSCCSFNDLTMACLGRIYHDFTPLPNNYQLASSVLLEAQITNPQIQGEILESGHSDPTFVLQVAEYRYRRNMINAAQKEALQALSLKLSFLPLLNESRSMGEVRDFSSYLQAVTDIKTKIDKLSQLKLSTTHLRKFLAYILPKKLGEPNAYSYADQIKPYLEKSLIYSLDKDFDLQAIQVGQLPTFDFSKKSSPFFYMHKDPSGGLRFAFCSDINTFNFKSGSYVEYKCPHTVIPMESSAQDHPFETTTCMVRMHQEKDRALILEDISQRKNLQMGYGPLSEILFSQAPLVDEKLRLMRGYPFLVLKEPGLMSLEHEIHRPFPSLEAGGVLKVFSDVANNLIDFAKKTQLIPTEMNLSKIVWSKDALGIVHGKLDTCDSLQSVSNERMQALSQSLLINLAAALGFVEDPQKVPKELRHWEKSALNKIQEEVFEEHYQRVLQLRVEVGAFDYEYASRLRGYIDLLIQRDEESFQINALENFAMRMCVCQPLFDFFQHIQSEDSLDSQPLEKLVQQLNRLISYCKKISLLNPKTCHLCFSEETASAIVRDVFKKYPEETLRDWSLFLHNAVNYELLLPYAGREKRFHIGQNYLIHKVPFSFWLKKGSNELTLEIFPIDAPPLGRGGYKKAKSATKVRIAPGRDPEMTQVAQARLNNEYSWVEGVRSGMKMQEKILALPGADKYFLGLPEKHAPYEVKGQMKQESVFPLFDGTFKDLILKKPINGGKKRFILRLSNALAFLQHVGEGICLIKNQGFSHGDIKLENVALIDGKSPLIFDFDLAAKLGHETHPNKCWTWDSIRQETGKISDKTDAYSYVMMFGQFLIDGFLQDTCVPSHEQALLVLKGISQNPNLYKIRYRKILRDALYSHLPKHFNNPTLGIHSILSPESLITQEFFAKVREYINKKDEKNACELTNLLIKAFTFDEAFSFLAKAVQADQHNLEIYQGVKAEESLSGTDLNETLKIIKGFIDTATRVESKIAIS